MRNDQPMADPYPRRPLYLFYGTQVEALQKARDAVVAMVLPGEGRDENLTEYYPASMQAKLPLAQVYDEIAGDLATISLIPDAPKCVIVTNPAELFGSARRGGEETEGGAKGAKRAEAVMAWLERELPATGHTLLLLAFEDEAAQLEVNEKSPLFQLVLKTAREPIPRN